MALTFFKMCCVYGFCLVNPPRLSLQNDHENYAASADQWVRMNCSIRQVPRHGFLDDRCCGYHPDDDEDESGRPQKMTLTMIMVIMMMMMMMMTMMMMMMRRRRRRRRTMTRNLHHLPPSCVLGTKSAKSQSSTGRHEAQGTPRKNNRKPKFQKLEDDQIHPRSLTVRP